VRTRQHKPLGSETVGDNIGSREGPLMTSMAQFEVAPQTRPDVAVIDVRGEVDLATSHELDEQLATLIWGRPELLVVDLTDVTFMDSTGLGVLVKSVRDVRAGGGDLRLVATQPQIIRLLELTGLDAVFTVFPTTEKAIAR
jgi:anti-sigma B factor antagonist